MKVHMSLNVSDLGCSVTFYEAFFGVPAHKRRPGYANFDLEEPPLKLSLEERRVGEPAALNRVGALNHLGVQVARREQVEAARERLLASGLATFDERDTTCCYAIQDKVWAHDPDGNAWEVYVLLDDMADEPPSETDCCALPGDWDCDIRIGALRIVLLCLALLGCLRAAQAVDGPPLVVRLPSARPSGNAVNDIVWAHFYAPRISHAGPAPAVVLVHSLAETRGGFTNRYMQRLARDLAARGIGCALMMLPFHMERGVADGQPYIRHFAGPDVDVDVAALNQSASDVSTVVDWLATRPDVDSNRIGAVGISMGAIVVHLAMGRDVRLSAGVALLGGGNLPELYRHSLPIRLFGGFSPELLTPDAVHKMQSVDPASYRRPRHVLMVEAARDVYVPPANAIDLWIALGRPPIQWVDTNHFALFLAESSVARTTAAFLLQMWNHDGTPLPTVHAPTLKLGLMTGLDSVLTPAVQWQFHTFATRADHIALLHSDLGWSGRGPFISLAVTVNAFVDAGVAQRLGAKSPKPYLSLHVVF